MNIKYLERIYDEVLNFKLTAFGAVNVVGPKWCGKTTTSEQFSKSVLKLQKSPNKDELIETAKINPAFLLIGDNPRLIDEWQDAPQIWDAVRNEVDERGEEGLFILTGSTSKKVVKSHTGTGRISKMKMYPMSLYESKESNGMVSLKKLFDGTENLTNGCVSDLSIEGLIFAACRGGWPGSLRKRTKEASLAVAKDYFAQIYEEDMFAVDNIKRNKSVMRDILRSYARNISTLAKCNSILKDVNTFNSLSLNTLKDYIDILERLYIVEDLEGWCPSIRSASAIRNGKKREFVDPSIAVAALGVSPEYFYQDLKTFGFIFETLCIRDLRVYSTKMNGNLSYYHDRYGLEVDVVLHLDDGRFALIECKLGTNQVEEAAKHLNEVERLINEYNKMDNQCKLTLPTLKIVLTGGQYGYKREDNVFVIPIGCLKD